MSGIIEPPILITTKITRYIYNLDNLIPHTSVLYYIYCFSGDNLVNNIQGIIEGEQYKEWTNDDWLDRFIKSKVDEL